MGGQCVFLSFVPFRIVSTLKHLVMIQLITDLHLLTEGNLVGEIAKASFVLQSILILH